MLTVSQLSKAYGDRILFRGVSFHVNVSDRIGLVGPNGSGKSTLFRLILGEMEPDEGKVILRNGVSVGYLPQEIKPSGHETVLELATAVAPEITALQNTLRAQPPNSEAWHAAQDRLDERRRYELEPKARRCLAGLSFRQSDFNRPTATGRMALLRGLSITAGCILVKDGGLSCVNDERRIWESAWLFWL